MFSLCDLLVKVSNNDLNHGCLHFVISIPVVWTVWTIPAVIKIDVFTL